MIGLSDIRAAAGRLSGHLVRTPFLRSRVLSAVTEAEIFVKFENHQFTASLKERGALNKLLQLDASARQRGVCALSAGNHAQAVAYRAKRLGIPATIVMPRTTPFMKIENTRAHGATIVLAGETVTDGEGEAARLTAEHGLTFLHPYDDHAVMAGQGTLALEMLADEPSLDALIVPIGGGGLISGVAIAAKATNPRIHIVGVQAAACPSMVEALRGEESGMTRSTIADGIAVKRAGILTREVVRTRVDHVLLVEEPDLVDRI
jgi:threonine dehydratase